MIKSQDKMLKRLGKKTDHADEKQMETIFEKHIKQIEKFLNNQENMDVLFVNYNNMIKDPQKEINEIAQFMQINDPDLVDKMIRVVDKDLYRNKKGLQETWPG